MDWCSELDFGLWAELLRRSLACRANFGRKFMICYVFSYHDDDDDAFQLKSDASTTILLLYGDRYSIYYCRCVSSGFCFDKSGLLHEHGTALVI